MSLTNRSDHIIAEVDLIQGAPRDVERYLREACYKCYENVTQVEQITQDGELYMEPDKTVLLCSAGLFGNMQEFEVILCAQFDPSNYDHTFENADYFIVEVAGIGNTRGELIYMIADKLRGVL